MDKSLLFYRSLSGHRWLFPLLDTLAQRAGVELDLHVAHDLPHIEIDALRIQHVIFTLVQNAIEAASIAEGTPRAVGIRVTSNRYGVEISVTDSGPGIPATAREQIFRPFFTTKTSGTGLGLASSRAIVEAHGGRIWADPKPDSGARICFSLPR